MEWYVLTRDEMTKKEIKNMEDISMYSKTFDKVMLRSDKFNKTNFLGYVVRKTGDKEKDKYNDKLVERIIYVNNVLLNNRLHEIVDYDYIKEIGQKAIIVDYYNGFLMTSAIKKEYFTPFENWGNKFSDDDYEDEEEYRGHNKQVILKRVMRGVIRHLIFFQKDIFEKGLFHIGLNHKHIVVQKDDNIKINGMRYIVRHIDGILDDPVITKVKYYGDVINKRYSPPELVEYIKSGGKTKVNAVGIFSYQLGVLLFDIFTKGEHFFGNITDDLVNSSNLYINEKRKDEKKELRKLIKDLIAEDPKDRILDFDKILERVEYFT
ncbi:hypothetical protein [Fervidobacterium sp. 2310opik-2]|uniref:hypothetical protein n=1 Tax=Fervidobacterium sp. 2310opik-2 TaxID=1755815 RepID=UPI0013E0B826|nr:hypothetical protein [Fervidobacterium sp. 2310opik-2]KAF2961319.1 hypothetical protein AS161_01880 [Fervidobacterium sp. 2310opik-2]